MWNNKEIAMIYSFAYSNFNHRPLVWHFSSCEFSQKIDKIQKFWLRLVLDDYESDYGNSIKNNGTTTMETKRLTNLYMKNILSPIANTKIQPHDITVRHHNTPTYSDKSLTALRSKIWNKLPTNIVIKIYNKI